MATNSVTNMKNWADEKYMELGRPFKVSMQTVGVMPLLKRAIRDRGQLFETKVEGNIGEKEATFISHLEGLGGRLLHKNITNRSAATSLWVWDDSVVEMYLTRGYISLEVVSMKEDFTENMRKFVGKFLLPPKTQGHVYAIVYQNGRLAMSNLGNASIPLVEKNYTDKVLSDYKFVVEDLNSSYPSGRLSILEGEPGTGKTHLVRAMLNEVAKGMFVLVPPDMVKNLGGPELLPLLMQYHGYHAGPIILLLEDADKCLVTRAGADTDTSVIQSILNLGDGIMGSMLDIRIIATTNAKKFEMDSAILRRGRLSKQMHVGPLDEKSAIRAFQNLLPNMDPLPATFLSQIRNSPNGEIPLSDVYGIARDNGWKPKEPTVIEEEDDDDDEFDDDDESDLD